MFRDWKWALLLAAYCLLSLGCATNPATGKNHFVLISKEEELRIGRAAASKINERFDLYPHQQLSNYIAEVGNRLARHSHRPDIRYHFAILDTPAVNAFALPGGYVYVTRGLLAHLNSEAELAAVLGHEIGHIASRHSSRQYSQQAVLDFVELVFSVGNETAILSSLINLATEPLVKGYGRKHELEADQLSFRYLNAAGYDALGMQTLLSFLEDYEEFSHGQHAAKTSLYHRALATHPSTAVRAEFMNSAVQGDSKVKTPGLLHRDRYLDNINGMQFGENPNGGIRYGGRFYHGPMNFRLDIPESWHLRNHETHLSLSNPETTLAVQLFVNQHHPSLDACEYVIGVLAPAELLFAGDGAPRQCRGEGEFSTPFGYRRGRFVNVRFDRRHFFFLAAAGNDDLEIFPKSAGDPLEKIAGSLAPLTRSDRKTAKGRILQVAQLPATASIEDLAGSAALDNDAVRVLRLLNHWPEGGYPLPGPFKTVVLADPARH